MKAKVLLIIFFAPLVITVSGFCQEQEKGSVPPYIENGAVEKLTLTEAVMCESVQDLAPRNPAVIFSTSVGSVSCFTMFDPVPETSVIYHKWYKKDRLSTTQRLVLEPPRWRTYSSIHLREADKGPWRVEVVGPAGGVLKILRFSITD